MIAALLLLAQVSSTVLSEGHYVAWSQMTGPYGIQCFAYCMTDGRPSLIVDAEPDQGYTHYSIVFIPDCGEWKITNVGDVTLEIAPSWRVSAKTEAFHIAPHEAATVGFHESCEAPTS